MSIPNDCARFPRDRSRHANSAIELAPLDIDPVFAHSHPQILHRQHGSVLTSALSTTAISRSLNPQRSSSPLAALLFATRLWCRLAGHREPCGGTQVPHRVVGAVVAGADSRVLVGIGCDVGDELLRCEGE